MPFFLFYQALHFKGIMKEPVDSHFTQRHK